MNEAIETDIKNKSGRGIFQAETFAVVAKQLWPSFQAACFSSSFSAA